MNSHNVYLCWLIPCILSFISSFALICNVLLTPGCRGQYFQQVSALLALADMIQTSASFPGNYGKPESPYLLCCIENYMLQIGVIYKLSIVVVMCAVSMFIILELRIPDKKGTYLMSSLAFATILLSISVYFQTANVYCHNEEFHYSDASKKERMSALILYCLVFFPLYISITALGIFCIVMDRKFSQMTATLTPGMRSLLLRFKLFPILFVLCFFPGTLELILFSVANKRYIAIHMLSGVSVSINGFTIAVSYFYYQRSYPGIITSFFKCTSSLSTHLSARSSVLSPSMGCDSDIHSSFADGVNSHVLDTNISGDEFLSEDTPVDHTVYSPYLMKFSDGSKGSFN